MTMQDGHGQEGQHMQPGGDGGLAQQPPEQVRKIEDYLRIDRQPSWNNFGGGKLNQYRLTALACGAECGRFENMPQDGIDLHYAYAHVIEMESSRGGEVINPIRIALIDKSGKAYGFVSDFLARELDTLRSVFGDGPWSEPLHIKVSVINTRRGFRVYTIAPV